MKRYLKYWLPVLCVLLIGGVCAGIAIWKQSSSNDTPYDYPYPLDSEQWNSMSEAEVNIACIIPEEVLDKLTTKALVRTLSERPGLSKKLLYSSNSLFNRERCTGYLDDIYYSGIRTLMERKDATKELLDWYEQMPYPETEEEISWDGMFGRRLNMELLIACDWYLNYDNGYVPEDRERLAKLIEERYERLDARMLPFSPMNSVLAE